MARAIAALIRHGEYNQQADTPSAHQPYGLTAQGKTTVRKQADHLAELVDQQAWTVAARIDSSNMLRAWQTAEIFAHRLYRQDESAQSIDCYDDLAERGVGSVANLTIMQIEKIIDGDPRYESLPAGWKSDSHYCLPFQGAESLMQAGVRVADHMLRQMMNVCVKSKADTATVKLFVGHGASFRHAAHHLGILEFEQLAQYSMFHAQPVLIEYLEDGSWQHIGGDWKLRDGNSGLD
ncbi:MAG: histidine phosphatase family protein [Gammaproteobacteria bacterium]|jgi:2,3-bisphosphoglycerate-dependent phosphoglycerate mutase